jgi:hypothetical protein
MYGFTQVNWLKGTWTGSAYQYDTKSTWSINLTVTDKYFVEYPSIPCKGHWVETSKEKKRIHFIEKIIPNTENCVQNCKTVVKKKGKNKIVVYFYLPNDQKIGAKAILKHN